jgi:hypothetical protein
VSFPEARCAYWLSAWPGARTCAAAHVLEASSDAVILRAGAGVIGAALLLAYGVIRYVQRRRGRGPAVVLAQLTGFAVTQGPGSYLSGAIVAAVAAVWYGRKARQAARYLMRRWQVIT